MSSAPPDLAHLSPEQRRTLAAHLLRKKAEQPRQFPLSFAQQRLWFLEQLEPGTANFNVPFAIRLKGRLDVPALALALGEVVRRHQSLRTSFTLAGGTPMQVVSDAPPVSLPVTDLDHLPEEEREAEARRLAADEARLPFDLARGPLLRAGLLRLGEVDHVALLTLHHIVSDAWSMSIFTKELAALYAAFAGGRPSLLPELPIQYADFAVWQRRWLQGARLETQLSYWRQQLGGAAPALDLPADRPRPQVPDHAGGGCELSLSAGLSESLRALGRRENVTPFMTLLAAFKVLLCRLSGQEEVIVGVPIAGRGRSETENLIGFFVNTLALRTSLSPGQTFVEVLRRVSEVALGAYAHQDLPFEKLVEELRPARHLNRHPIFDVTFNYGNTPPAALELPGLTLSPFELPDPQSKFSLTLNVEEGEQEFRLALTYQRALYSPERIGGLLHQLRHLLAQIAADPDRAIRSYSLVAPESLAVLPDPRAVLPEPQYEPVTNLFLAWAERAAERPALLRGGRAWTYSRLASRALCLAGALRRGGLKPGEVVALTGPPSFGLVAGMLGVLFCRGVLLVIDPKLPVNRRRLMLREASAKHLLLVGAREGVDRWMSESIDRVIACVDPDDGRLDEPSDGPDHEESDREEVLGDDPAYVVFTSGTTGTPKGILGCHKGLSHFLDWQRKTFGVGPHDRCAQLSNPSFDPFLREIFLPLTSGGSVCLPAEEDAPGSGQILKWLESEGVTLLHVVPSLARAWLADAPRGISLDRLRWAFIAGEPLTGSLIKRWRATFPGSGEIVNLYGPTETTMLKCYYPVPPNAPEGPLPVGVPLPQTQALVLDDGGQICGVGEPGEVVLRTPFRTLGYLNAPEEERQRFVANPFRDDSRDVVYYTGDRGRYRPDGSLEVCGRLDHQIKIRGVRVEVNEIESLLGRHPGVSGCAVTAREDLPEDQRLIAYFTPKSDSVPAAGELREFLRRELSESVVPSRFIPLESLPLNANGKVDRKRLPAPDGSRPAPAKTFLRPRDTFELRLANLWEEVLNVRPVGVRDNFFELGGHSLLAVRLLSQVHQEFGQRLPLSSLFKGASVEEMAAALRRRDRASAGSPLIAIQPGGAKIPFFCVHPAGGGVLCYYALARHLGADQPFFGFQSPGYEGEREPLTRVADLAAHYLAALRAFRPDGPYLLGGYSMGAFVAYEMAQQLRGQGERVGLLALLDPHSPPRRGEPEAPPEVDEVTFLCREFGDLILVSEEDLRLIAPDRRVDHLLERAKRADLIPSDVGVSRVRTFISVYQANARALSAYSPRPYDGMLTLFRAGERVDAGGLDPTGGWGELAAGRAEIHFVPGSHESLILDPHVEVLAEKLRSCLSAAGA